MLCELFAVNNKGPEKQTILSQEEKERYSRDYYGLITNLYLSAFNSTYKYEPEDQAILKWRLKADNIKLSDS